MREISLRTDRRTQLVEITDEVRQALEGANSASAALVYVPHTTAGVTINERIDPDLVETAGLHFGPHALDHGPFAAALRVDEDHLAQKAHHVGRVALREARDLRSCS